MPEPVLPPPNPYSTKLAERIYALTASRDEEIVHFYKTADPEKREEFIGEAHARWKQQVLEGCIEALEHAENVIENWKKILTEIKVLQQIERVAYPDKH